MRPASSPGLLDLPRCAASDRSSALFGSRAEGAAGSRCAATGSPLITRRRSPDPLALAPLGPRHRAGEDRCFDRALRDARSAARRRRAGSWSPCTTSRGGRCRRCSPRIGARWHEAMLRRALSLGAITSSSHRSWKSPRRWLQSGDSVDSDRVSVIAHGADHLPPADLEGTRAPPRTRLGVAGEFLLAVGHPRATKEPGAPARGLWARCVKRLARDPGRCSSSGRRGWRTRHLSGPQAKAWSSPATFLERSRWLACTRTLGPLPTSHCSRASGFPSSRRDDARGRPSRVERRARSRWREPGSSIPSTSKRLPTDSSSPAAMMPPALSSIASGKNARRTSPGARARKAHLGTSCGDELKHRSQ